MRVNSGERLKMAVSGSGSAQELYQRVCRAEREALQNTLDNASLDSLLAVTQALHNAERVFIVAHDFSRIPAAYLEHRLISLGVDCRPLDLQARSDMLRQLSAVEPQKGLLFAITVPPIATTPFPRLGFVPPSGCRWWRSPTAWMLQRPVWPRRPCFAMQSCWG